MSMDAKEEASMSVSGVNVLLMSINKIWRKKNKSFWITVSSVVHWFVDITLIDVSNYANRESKLIATLWKKTNGMTVYVSTHKWTKMINDILHEQKTISQLLLFGNIFAMNLIDFRLFASLFRYNIEFQW